MNFKGTKGKFHYHESSYRHFVSDENRKEICIMSEEQHVYDAAYNGLLFSKAPEMLERLYQQNIDLKIMAANVKQLEGSVWILEGMSALIQKWITENETIIKQATEL